MCAHYQTRLSVIDFLFDLVKSSTFSPSQSLSLTLSVLCFSACFCSMYVTAVVRAVAMHFLVFLLTTSLVCMPALFTLAQLSPAFYAQSCPSAVSTVTNSIISLAKKDNVVAPSMLRLILHDCFVEGCDGSILLSSTSGNKAERDAPDNVNLPQNAFNAIIAAKKAVEQVCPGVVSCADILALAARDVVVFLGGPTWDVPLGRLDGRVSTAASVEGRLPGANFNIKQLSDNFGSVGLSLQDMVILSGAHTIGFSHCDQFKNRLYSFNSSVTADPSLDAGFAQQLQKKCPAAGGDNLQAFDIQSPFTFDNNYFKDLQSGKGLLFSDQVLFQDASTRSTVESMAASQDAFFKSFAASMIKMTLIAPKQGGQGEVRKECTIVNAGGANVKPSPSGGNVSPTTGSASPPAKPVSQPAAPVAPSPPPPKPVPIAMPPPKAVPVILPPPPPSPNLQPPSPKPTPLLSPPPPSPPPPQVLPPPLQAFPPPTPVSFNPPEVSAPPPSGGITIPGIPGFTAPIHIPFPRFGGSPPPPSSSQSSSKKPAGKKSRRRRV